MSSIRSQGGSQLVDSLVNSMYHIGFIQLAGEYKGIWELAKPYLAKGRTWDLWHTELSIGFMQRILEGEDKNIWKRFFSWQSSYMIPAGHHWRG